MIFAIYVDEILEDGLFTENLINCVVYDAEQSSHLLHDIERSLVLSAGWGRECLPGGLQEVLLVSLDDKKLQI